MAASEDSRNPAGRAVLPLAQEAARVEKRKVLKGRVRVHSATETFEEFAEAELASDETDVTRVPIGRVVTETPKVRVEGEVTIVPVLEEVLVVEKQLVLKEEIHIRRERSSETVRIPVALRRQRAVVEREATENEEYDDGLRK